MEQVRLILIFELLANVGALKCYFCKSDYDSKKTADEEKTKDIPHCGREPYRGDDQHVVTCDVYYDNFDMVNPTFKMAMSSTTTGSKSYRARKKRYVSNGNPTLHNGEKERLTINGPTTEGFRRIGTTMKPRQLYKDVYPYNLNDAPWGTQRVHPRVSPYLCLTVRTINSTFSNRVCGLRYFLDCRLLIELTSEPLQQSSFVTKCHQCDSDYCNRAVRPDIYFRSMNLRILSTIYCLYVMTI